MTKRLLANTKPGFQTSPWIILGTTTILLVVVLVFAFEDTQRKKHYISDILSIKGAALIRAVEAGARTGMMGWQLGGRHVQRLLEETAYLPDVLYMAILDEDGKVVAHSDPKKIGSAFRKGDKVIHLGPHQQESWDLVKLPDGKEAFEVHRYFRPLALRQGRFPGFQGMMMHHRGMGMGRSEDDNDWLTREKLKHLLIVVGMDVAPLRETVAAEIRTTIFLAVILLLLGFSALVSLFWMHHYRETKKTLQDTSAVANKVVTHLPVGVIATDSQGNIAFLNEAAENITGAKAMEVLGRSAHVILPEELFDLQKKLQNTNSITDREIECVFGDDRNVPLSISAARIINEVGEFVGNVLILKDLGEVRRLQEEVRRQEKLAAVGGLAAGVAHEIRNPLSSIKGMATYFAGLFEEKSESWKAAHVMIQEVERLNRAISELLEFARPTDLKRCELQIEPLLRRTLQLIQQDALTHGISVDLKLTENLCPIWADPDRISQCLLNLYLNAIQAMDRGGHLKVVAAMDSKGHLCIQISDTGAGIAPENLVKIFDPYFTTKPSGTGLGLAIVHKIVSAHDGHLKVVSHLSKGTTFSIWIPCKGAGKK